MSPTSKSSQLLLPPIKWAIGSWSFFIAENIILSENRTFIIQNICNNNDDYYHYMYGAFSTTALGSIIYAYYGHIQPFSNKNIHKEELKLWRKVPFMNKLGSFVFVSLGLGLLSQTLPKLQIPLEYTGSSPTTTSLSSNVSNSQEQPCNNNNNQQPKNWKVRCPFDFTDSKSKQYGGTSSSRNNNQIISTIQDIHGIDRITRHPGLWSFGFTSFGISFLSPCLPTKIYFTMPLIMAFMGGYHHDTRFNRGIGGSFTKGYEELTSNVPFYALIVGKQGDDRVILIKDYYENEVKGLNLVLGMGIATLLVVRKGRVGGVGGKLLSKS